MEKIIHLCTSTLENEQFISAIWSNPRSKQDAYEKCIMKPVVLKDIPYVQFTLYKNNKAYHHNIPYEAVGSFIETSCGNFKQVQLFTASNDFAILINKKGQATIKKLPPTKECPTCHTHNRTKHYVLDNTNAKAFLVQLGLMSEDGQVKPSKYDKYKQINKYLETIESVMKEFNGDFLRIIDFGCGKSYLTFAMYYYLTEILNKSVEIVGLDLKEDVITFCNQLAHQLGYTNLKFQVGDIGKYTTNQQIDMVVSLHACNTATDAALAKAVNWNAKIILAVPCCHNECYTQIQNKMLSPILKHGILKERIAALVTDGLRGQLLEAVGYNVSIMEFIDMQHTPKNILIKAIKTSTCYDESAYKTYHSLCQELHLNLSLPEFLNMTNKS